MISKIMFLLLGAILLLEGHNSAPNQEMDSTINGLEERLKLQNLFVAEINDLNLIILKEGATVLKLVLKDPKVLDIQSDSMKAKLDEIRNFIRKFEYFEKKVNKQKHDYAEVNEEFDRITFRSQDSTIKNPPEDEIIKQSLKENGFVAFSPAGKEHFTNFTNKFCEELEEYINGLNETEKKDELRMQNLMEEMKTESDPKKRGDLITKFLISYDMEYFLE